MTVLYRLTIQHYLIYTCSFFWVKNYQIPFALLPFPNYLNNRDCYGVSWELSLFSHLVFGYHGYHWLPWQQAHMPVGSRRWKTSWLVHNSHVIALVMETMGPNENNGFSNCVDVLIMFSIMLLRSYIKGLIRLSQIVLYLLIVDSDLLISS